MKMRKWMGRKGYVYKPHIRIEHLAMPTPQNIGANIAPFQSSISLTEAMGLETARYPSIWAERGICTSAPPVSQIIGGVLSDLHESGLKARMRLTKFSLNPIADVLKVGFMLWTTHFPANLPRARMGKCQGGLANQ